MKSATTVITILTIATSLLSCQKDKTSTLPSTAITPAAFKTTGAIPPVLTGDLAYSMNTAPAGANDIIKWNAGSMNVYTVSFEGYVKVGSSMEKRTYTTGIGEARALYTQFQLNSVTVPYDTYTGAIFRVSLNPYSTPNSLYLTGTTMRPVAAGDNPPVSFTSSDPGAGNEPISSFSPRDQVASKAATKVLQVQLRISEPVDLTTTYTQTLAIDYGGYQTRLLFDPGRLLADITPQMMGNAQVKQGVIYISEVENRPLYDMIRKNMSRAMSVDFSKNVSYVPAIKTKPLPNNGTPL